MAGTLVAAEFHPFLPEEELCEAHIDIPRLVLVLADINWQAAMHGSFRAVKESMHWRNMGGMDIYEHEECRNAIK